MALNPKTAQAAVLDRTGLTCKDFGGDTVFNTAIASALAEFSKRKLRIIYGTFNVVSGVTEYLFPSATPPVNPSDPGFPANCIGITDLFYSPQSLLGNNLSFEDMLLQTVQGTVVTLDFGGNIFESPSLVRIWFEKLREFRDTIGTPDWRIIETSPKKTIQLLDPPEQATLGYWEGYASWTLDDIQSDDFETFYKALLWKLCETRAMKLAVAVSYTEGPGGAQVQPAFKFWNDKAAQFKKEFFDDVGEGRGIISVG